MKKLFSLLLAMAAVFTLAGCQLAKDGSEASAEGSDKLIGVLITTDYLDTFDMQSYLQDNLDEVLKGDVTLENTRAYQQRIYADQIPKEEDGITTADFTFSGLDGIRFLNPTVKFEDSSNNYTTIIMDEGISDVHQGIHVTDDGTMQALEGTIYTAVAGEYNFCMNPVYQDAEGRVYAVQGDAYSGSTLGEMTLTLNESFTSDFESYSFEVKVTFTGIAAPSEIEVLQMDENNQILKSETFSPGNVPTELTTEAGTAYIIVVTHSVDGTLTREIYSQGAEAFYTFRLTENSLCAKATTQIHWTE